MNPGYQNYWVRNLAEGAVPNLPRNGSFNESALRANNAQRGSEMGDIRAVSQNPRTSGQDLLSMFRGPPEYNWRGNVAQAASSSLPLNFVGAHFQHYNPQRHWQNFGSSNTEIRSSVPQPTSYMYQGRSSSQNQNPKQTPWIRVRDVNSLNNMAQSLGRIDGGLDWPTNNVNKHPSQRSYSQLLRESSFQQPSFQVIGSSPPPPYQERCPNVCIRPGAQTSSNQYRVEQQYGGKSSLSILEEMLIQTEKMATLKSTEVPRAKGRMYSPNVNRSYLNQPGFQNYNLNQPLFEKQLPYKGTLEARTGEPVIPVNREQQQSSPSVSNVTVHPEWYSGIVFKKLPIPTEEDYNLRKRRGVMESEISEKLRKDNVPMEVECGNVSMDVRTQDAPIEVQSEDVSMNIKTECAPVEEPTENVSIKTEEGPVNVGTEHVPNDIKAEDPPSSVFTSTGANAAKNDNAPDNLLEFKEEPPSSNFHHNNTLDIVTQKLKTEDLQKQKQPVTQNKGQISDESFPTSSTGWDEGSGEESETDKLLAVFPSWVTSDSDLSEESFSNVELSLPMPQPRYKSEINREKLEMLKEFIKGVDRRQSISKERKTPVKEKTDRPPKENKSPEKDQVSPVLNKVNLKVNLTRLSAKDLEAAKCGDFAKETKQDEQPAVKKEPKEMENADKPSPESEHKKLNLANWQNPEDAQETHPKRKPEPIKKDSKRKSDTKENTENKSMSAENQTEVTEARRRSSKSPEKSKKLKTDKKKTDADGNLEKAEDRSQGNDIIRREKHTVQQKVEVASADVEDGMHGRREREEKNQSREKGSEKCTGKEFTNAKVLLCGRCKKVKLTPFIWMNISTRNLICSECLNIPKPTHKPSANLKNQETQTDKIFIGRAHSPIEKDDSNSSTSELDCSWTSSMLSSDDETSQGKHITGNKECRRSVDERAEKNATRPEPEEGKKIKEPSSEAPASTSKVACLCEGARSDRANKKIKNPPDHFYVYPWNFKPMEFFGNPTPKSVSKTEKKPETTKKQDTLTENKPQTPKKRDTSREKKPQTPKKQDTSGEKKPQTPKKQDTSREKKPETPKKQDTSREKKPETPKKQNTSREKKPETIKKKDTSREKKPETTKNRDTSTEKKPETIKKWDTPTEKKSDTTNEWDTLKKKKTEASKKRDTSTEKKPETTKKRDNSTEDLRLKKRKSVEENTNDDLNKTARHTMEICRGSLDALKKLFSLKENKKKKNFRGEVDRLRGGKKRTPTKGLH